LSLSLDQFIVKQLPIDVSTSGDNIIIPAVSQKQLWVIRCVLISNGTVTAQFRSGATSFNITGPFYLVANTGFSISQDEGQYVTPWFATRAGQGLNLNLSDNIAIGGVLSYIEVDGVYSSSSSSSSCSSSSSSSCRSSSSSSSLST
jgi:hypothetical protein